MQVLCKPKKIKELVSIHKFKVKEGEDFNHRNTLKYFED